MRRFILFLSVVCLGGLASAAMAGDYHTGGTLICTDCHVMHGSQAHDYNIGSVPREVPIGPDAPYANLLRNDVNDLCLTCHDGNTFVAPDVFGTNDNSNYNGVREAGGLNADPAYTGKANTGGYTPEHGHSLGYTGDIPGGGTQATELECTSCHAQHGSSTQWRNLLNRGIFSGKALTYAKSTNSNTKDVFERNATNFASAHYAPSNVDFNEPSQTASAYANWCKTCHVAFHGVAGDGATVGGNPGGYESMANFPGWLRHPNANVDIGTFAGAASPSTHVSSFLQFKGYGGKTNWAKVMSAVGDWTGAAGDTTSTPSCFSCHKAHGNENPFGLVFMDTTGTVTENGTAGGTHKQMCRQCHSQGG